MTFSIISTLLFVGCLSGFMAGLLGVGGGLVLVPILTILLPKVGISQQWIVPVSIATASATIVFTAIRSILTHQANKAVIWPLVYQIAPGLLIGGGIVSTWLLPTIPSRGLIIFFTIIVMVSSKNLWQDKKPKAAEVNITKTTYTPTILGVIGIFIGTISGLVGAGGGFLSVPLLNHMGIKIHQAIGTSSALGIFIALGNTIPSILWVETPQKILFLHGLVYWPAVLAICSTSIIFSSIGAKTAHKMDTKPLKKIFSVLLVLMAISMLAKI